MVEEEPENLLRGLENFPGETWSLTAPGIDGCNTLLLLSGSNKSPNFVSNGSGLSESSPDSETGLVFLSLSLAFSAACSAFSLLRVISFHGFMVTWKPGFLLVSVEEGERPSPSTFMDSLFWWFCQLKKKTQNIIYEKVPTKEAQKSYDLFGYIHLISFTAHELGD